MNNEVIKLQSVVDRLLSNKETIKVLEAGCGSLSRISIKQSAHIVGIDISEKQLQRNPVLHEKILGDIQSYDFPDSDFDVIVCWWVLEHLPDPKQALVRFIKAIKKDGIIILSLPNILSVKGLITKYTPHWFHIWVHKHFYGHKLAGTDDHGPFPTFLRFSVKPASIKKLALENDLSVEYFSMFESLDQKRMQEKNSIIYLGLKLLKPLVKMLSFGTIDAELSECTLVLRK